MPRSNPQTGAVAAAIKAKAEAMIEARAEEKAQAMVRDRWAGFIQRLCARLQPGQTPDEAGLTEADLQAIFYTDE